MDEIIKSELRLDRAPSLTEATVAKLAKAIFSGHFAPGHHLAEVQLARDLGVSRAILREAFRTLAAEGLIEIRRNYGAHVIQPSPDDIEQMSVFRAMIEGLAARLLTYRRDETSLSKLDDIVARLKAAHRAADRAAFLDLHWLFHQAICEQSGNKFLAQSWNSVSRIIRTYQRNALNHIILLQNNQVFVHEFRHSSPERVEQLIRGQIIKTAYAILRRPIPRSVRAYVKLYIDEKGRIQKFTARD